MNSQNSEVSKQKSNSSQAKDDKSVGNESGKVSGKGSAKDTYRESSKDSGGNDTYK